MSDVRTRILLSLLTGTVAWSVALAQPLDAAKLDADILSQLHKQIRPQPGESRWPELRWD